MQLMMMITVIVAFAVGHWVWRCHTAAYNEVDLYKKCAITFIFPLAFISHSP
jgi:hypothetical protein